MGGMFGASNYLGAAGNLFGGFGQKRESASANRQAKKRTAAALGELTPEAMQGLIQRFYSQYYSMMNPQMQAAFSHIASNLGRTGMTGAGVANQLRAGIPGQFAMGAMGQAFGSALPVAMRRASIQAGRPITGGKSGMSILGDTVKGFTSSGAEGNTPVNWLD